MSQSHLSVAAPTNDRPILDEAKRKSLIAVVGSAVSAALSFGVISPDLAEQINSGWAYVLGAIVTVLPALTSVLHALGIVKGSEAKTTPVDSPADADGTPLVPLHAAGLDEADETADQVTNVTTVDTNATAIVLDADSDPAPDPAVASSMASIVPPAGLDDTAASTARHAQS